MTGPLDAEFTVERSTSPAAPDDHQPFTLTLTLRVDPGETVALVGPNGAGKSTAISALAGLTPPTTGHIELGSRTLDRPADRIHLPPEDRRVGVVFQDYLLFDHLSARDNVAFGLRCRGRGRREAADLADQWLERVGVADLADRHPRRLSGGQAQRVALARALAGQPDLLLLDEPLAALDVATTATTRRLLADHLRDFDGPRIVVTHDPVDALALAHRICVLEQGRVTQSGTADELRRRPATGYIAALAGLNLFTGQADRGAIAVDDTDFVLRTADPVTGPVRAVVDPRAVSLYPERPEGSPRNTWEATIDWIEPLGDTCRIRLGAPLPLMVDITAASVEALGLRPGHRIWAAVKATEVTCERTATDDR